jgi:hypothetical protein
VKPSDSLDCRLYVSFCKISALEEQRRVHRFGKGVSSAITKSEPRLGIDALAIAPERLKGEGGKTNVMRNNLSLDQGKKIFEVVKPVDAAFGNENVPRFLIGHSAHEAAIGSGNRFLKGCAFRFVIQNSDQCGGINDDHLGMPKSS